MPVDIVGLDSAIIQNPKAWVASGHVGGFSDPMVDCTETKFRYRADHVVVYKPKEGEGFAFAFIEGSEADDIARKIKNLAKGRSTGNYDVFPLVNLDTSEYGNIIGPDSKNPGTLTEPKQFNLMFHTFVGATAGEDNKAYLRPETAQGIFLNFKNVVDSSRVRMPFGIAQIGKAFRNEVTPRNFIYRSREFEQMELEWFCHPDEAAKWRNFWFEERQKFWRSLGLSSDNIQMRDHDSDELSHYAKAGLGTADIEYRFPFTAPGFGELEGIAHRCDFDLKQHS
jgi:glycyl-tRNA synthetase